MAPYTAAGGSKGRTIIAAILAFLIPGTGHFFLGHMRKGIFIMILLALDIAAIPYFYLNGNGPNIPLIVLFSCLIPVIYFYNLFDAIRLGRKAKPGSRQPGEPAYWSSHEKEPVGTETEQAWENTHTEGQQTEGRRRVSPGLTGILLILAGGYFILRSKKPEILEWTRYVDRTYIGAFLLIGTGCFLYLVDNRRK